MGLGAAGSGRRLWGRLRRLTEVAFVSAVEEFQVVPRERGVPRRRGARLQGIPWWLACCMGNNGGDGGGCTGGGGCESCDEVTAEAMEAFFGVSLLVGDETGATTWTVRT